MGTDEMIDPNAASNYLSEAQIRQGPNGLLPLNRLSSLEVEQHLKAPRTQFAFLADIRRFREEKAKRKYLDIDQSSSEVVITNPRR